MEGGMRTLLGCIACVQAWKAHGIAAICSRISAVTVPNGVHRVANFSKAVHPVADSSAFHAGRVGTGGGRLCMRVKEETRRANTFSHTPWSPHTDPVLAGEPHSAPRHSPRCKARAPSPASASPSHKCATARRPGASNRAGVVGHGDERDSLALLLHDDQHAAAGMPTKGVQR